MGCMSVFFVLVVVLLALVIGGILSLIWVLLLCSMLTGEFRFRLSIDFLVDCFFFSK